MDYRTSPSLSLSSDKNVTVAAVRVEHGTKQTEQVDMNSPVTLYPSPSPTSHTHTHTLYPSLSPPSTHTTHPHTISLSLSLPLNTHTHPHTISLSLLHTRTSPQAVVLQSKKRKLTCIIVSVLVTVGAVILIVAIILMAVLIPRS